VIKLKYWPSASDLAMCEKCYSYIYDYILSPLSMTHILNEYIDRKAFKRCSHEVADCISRALRDYVNNRTLIDCYKLFRETYDANAQVMEIIEPLDIPKETKEQRYDEWIWNKFKETNQEDFKELNHAIQICMDSMVVKKIKCKEQLLEHFFMHKLRYLLNVLPDIHKEHTEKIKFDNVKSLGRVPQDRIDHIRRMAGLPVRGEVCISVCTFDELYN
jgi:hypothetical protein